ncbi:MAG: ABC transporter ATP-binding protein, partial [Candidatus Kapaibacterium sp.]
KLKNENISILVSTPYMDEAALCDRIALILNGEFLKIDIPTNIVNEYKHQLYSVKGKQMSKLLKDLRSLPYVRTSFAFGDSHHVTMKDSDFDINQLIKSLKQMEHEDIRINEVSASIEDCFLELIVENSLKG